MEESERFELVTVHPGFILGPSLLAKRFFTEMIITKMLTGVLTGLPDMHVPFVDVRDVSEFIIKAMEFPGGRYICQGEVMELVEIGNILHEEYSPFGYKVTKNKLNKVLLVVLSLVIKEIRPVIKLWGKRFTIDDSKSREMFG